MIRINLLPHREGKTKIEVATVFMVCGLVLVSVFGRSDCFPTLTQSSTAISLPKRRGNNFLKSEIAVLDKQIDEIKKLEGANTGVARTKQIIEIITADRAEAVSFVMSELVKQMPESLSPDPLSGTTPRYQLVGLCAIERPGINPDAEHRSFAVAGGRSWSRSRRFRWRKRRLNEFSLFAFLKRETPEGGKNECRIDRGRLDLKSLADDFRNLSPATMSVHVASSSAPVFFVAILAAGWWFVWNDQLGVLEDAPPGRKTSPQDEFVTKKTQAVNLSCINSK